MDFAKREETNFVIKTVYNHTLARGKVEVNRSMKGLEDCGEMRSAGFRGASDKGRTFGVTALSQKTGRSVAALLEDKERMLEMAAVNEILSESMASLCLRAFQSNRDLALQYTIPSFSDTTWTNSPNANVIASSIVCTRDGFFNKPHRDEDATPYTYALFSKINRATGEIHWDAQSDYLGEILDCCFILDEYNVELFLDACDGLVESIWASDELHHTSPSKTYDESHTMIPPSLSPITRFGASLQISKVLLKRIDGLLKKKEGKSVEEWEAYKKTVVKCYHQEFDNKMAKCIGSKALS